MQPDDGSCAAPPLTTWLLHRQWVPCVDVRVEGRLGCTPSEAASHALTSACKEAKSRDPIEVFEAFPQGPGFLGTLFFLSCFQCMSRSVELSQLGPLDPHDPNQLWNVLLHADHNVTTSRAAWEVAQLGTAGPGHRAFCVVHSFLWGVLTILLVSLLKRLMRCCRPHVWAVFRVIPGQYRRRQLSSRHALLGPCMHTRPSCLKARTQLQTPTSRPTPPPLRFRPSPVGLFGIILLSCRLCLTHVHNSPPGPTSTPHPVRPLVNAHGQRLCQLTPARKRAFKRAQIRAAQDGSTIYRGQRHDLCSLSAIRIGNAHQHARPRVRAAPSSPSPHPSLTYVSWNCGGLNAARFTELLAWLHDPGAHGSNPPRIVCVQETKWAASSEFSSGSWHCIHSGIGDSNGGVLIMVHSSLARADQLRHCEVIAGRVLHVRLDTTPPTDLLGVYQVAWNPQHSTLHGSTADRVQALLARRLHVWTAIQTWISGVPRRNGLLMLGDFNCTLAPNPPNIGQGVTDGSSPHQDREEFQRIVCQNGLVALNSWSRTGSQSSTFIQPTGSGAQLDYAIARLPCHPRCLAARGLPTASIVHPTGFRHVPVVGSIDRPSLPHCPSRPPNLTAKTAAHTIKTNPAFTDCFQQAVAERLQATGDINHVLLEAWNAIPTTCPKPSERGDRNIPHPRLDSATQASLKQLWAAKRDVRQALAATDTYLGPLIMHIARCATPAVLRSFPRATQGLRSWVYAWRSVVHFHCIDRQLRKAARSRKLRQLEDLIREAQASPEQGVLGLYRIIHRFRPKSSKRTIHFRGPDGSLLTVQEELQLLRNYFGDLFQEATKPPAPAWSLSEGINPTLSEVTSALESLPHSKALPGGHAPATLWRQVVPILAPVVTQQLQLALGPGRLNFPAPWHLSFMVLIPKEGKPPTAPQHLRPICLLPAMAKITARILAGRVRPYLEQALAQVPQFAYLRSRQTADALDRVLSHCQQVRLQLSQYRNSIFAKRSGAQHRHFCGGLQISLDLSKAYDRIPRDKLHQALLRIGAPPDLIAAIMYIHDNAKIVLERHGRCESVPLAAGIRQGCGLSPLLWLAFTLLLYDELVLICPQNAITCFADDFHMHWTLASPRDFRNACQHIVRIFDVFQRYGMRIATDKTVILLAMKGPETPSLLGEFVHWRGRDRFLVLPTSEGTLRIPVRQSHKYLGVQIGYGKFERSTLTARLKLSWVAFSRLHVFLKHPGLPVSRRIALWRTYIWTILQYGLTSVGLDEWAVAKLRSQVAKQIRLVARSPGHISHETTQQLYARLGLQDPLIMLGTACRKRILASTQALGHLQPSLVHQWWARLQQTFQTCAPASALESDTLHARLCEVTQVTPLKYACPECGQHFPSSHALSVHIGKQHPSIRPRKARSTRDKQVRCEDYRQHSLQGMPQCRHCGKCFYGWLQFRGHFSQQACPVLHYGQHAVGAEDPVGSGSATKTSSQILKTPTSDKEGVRTTDLGPQLVPAYGAFAPGDDRPKPETPQEQPLFERPDLQSLAKRHSITQLAAAIRDSRLTQHCPVCFQWVARSSYVARHACAMHPTVAAAQEQVAKWAQTKPPPLCPCNWCGTRFRGPAAVHRKACPVLWMCGHFLHRFDSLNDPGQSSLDDFRSQEHAGAQGSGSGAGKVGGVHATSDGGGRSLHSPEQREGFPGELRAEAGPALSPCPHGSGSGEAEDQREEGAAKWPVRARAEPPRRNAHCNGAPSRLQTTDAGTEPTSVRIGGASSLAEQAIARNATAARIAATRTAPPCRTWWWLWAG